MIEPDRLLEGALRTLEHSVLPAIGSGFARGQLFAVLEVLANLQGQTEWGGALLQMERTMLDDLIATAAEDRAITGDLGSKLRAYRDAPTSPLCDRLRKGRRLVCELIDAAHADSGSLAGAIDSYLCNEAISKVMALGPGRLAEISQG